MLNDGVSTTLTQMTYSPTGRKLTEIDPIIGRVAGNVDASRPKNSNCCPSISGQATTARSSELNRQKNMFSVRTSPRLSLQGKIIGWAFAVGGPLVGLSNVSALLPGGTIKINNYLEDDLVLRMFFVLGPIFLGLIGVLFIRAGLKEQRDRDLGLTPTDNERRS